MRALIFDVDGTLADTERNGHRIAFNLAFREMGICWEWDEQLYGELLQISGARERIRYYINRYEPDCPPAGPVTPELIDELLGLKTGFFISLVKAGEINIRPGVFRLIEEAHNAGLRLAVATATVEQNVSTLLEYAFGQNIRPWFEVVAAADAVSKKKPSPDIYRYLLEKLGLHPQQCIAFEDSENGLKASTGAGISTIITVNQYTRTQNFSSAATVVDNLGTIDKPAVTLSGPNPLSGSGIVNLDAVYRIHANDKL